LGHFLIHFKTFQQIHPTLILLPGLLAHQNTQIDRAPHELLLVILITRQKLAETLPIELSQPSLASIDDLAEIFLPENFYDSIINVLLLQRAPPINSKAQFCGQRLLFF
jgi:hypothetical protein